MGVGMKIAILIGLSISGALMSGCASNNVAMSKPKASVDNTQQVAIIAAPEPLNSNPEVTPEPPKPVVRRTAVIPQVETVIVATEIPAIPEPPISTPPAPVIAEPKSNWIPNEVHLIRGNELISGLQRDIGRKPTLLEMQQRLQTHMGLSAPQANQVIATLGLQ